MDDGDLVTLEPCAPENLAVGDIVLVRVHRTDYLHLIKARNSARFPIGNNQGGINDWVGGSSIFSKATKIEP